VKSTPEYFWGGGAEDPKANCCAKETLNKLASKMAKVCCDGLLWAHLAANFIILSFVFFSHHHHHHHLFAQ